MTARFGAGSAARFGRLRVPSHRASSATLSGAYPFLAPEPCRVGPLIGSDALTGEPFSFDPWALYAAGALTNPNVALAGVIGSGKSALAKSLVVRAIASGRRAYVPGDPKGEWSVVAEHVGGVVLRLGPGLPARLNPLDAGSGTSDPAGQRSRVLAAVAESLLGRDMSPGERAALDVAVEAVAAGGRQPVVSDVVAALVDPDPSQARADGVSLAERVVDGRDVAHGLRRLVRGDLAGMFDAPSTVTLDPDAPMVVVDLSALGSDDLAVAVAMTCAASWLEGALGAGSGVDTVEAPVGRWIVYDEAWRLLRSPALVRRMQAQWKLSRAHGIANLLVLHRLSDLDAVGAQGSEARALAAGLLADCSTRVIYRQETDQLSGTQGALGLTDTERALLPSLPRGCGLWKLPRASRVVHNRLHADELALYDTDFAMRTGGWPVMKAVPLAERATLGALLTVPAEAHRSGVRRDGVHRWLRPEDFIDPWHAEVYRSIRVLAGAGDLAGPEAVGRELLSRFGPTRADVVRVAELLRDVPPHARTETYAVMVLEASLRRQAAAHGLLLRAGALQARVSTPYMCAARAPRSTAATEGAR